MLQPAIIAPQRAASLRIGIGEKSLAKGEVELKPRGGSLIPAAVDQVVDRVLSWLEEAEAALRPT